MDDNSIHLTIAKCLKRNFYMTAVAMCVPLNSAPNRGSLTSVPKRSHNVTAKCSEKRNARRVLARKPEEKRPLGSPRRRWEDNIKIDLREIGRGDVDWISLAQGRNQWRAFVNMLMNLPVLYNVRKFLSS
jgi:hypothetical protein